MNGEQITEKDKSMNANEKKGNATKLRKVQNVQMAVKTTTKYELIKSKW